MKPPAPEPIWLRTSREVFEMIVHGTEGLDHARREDGLMFTRKVPGKKKGEMLVQEVAFLADLGSRWIKSFPV